MQLRVYGALFALSAMFCGGCGSAEEEESVITAGPPPPIPLAGIDMDCATDRDCEGDMTCGSTKKKCKKSCVTDRDCPVPFTCEEFFSFSGCRMPCTDDRDCKEGFICQAVDYGSFCFWSPPPTALPTPIPTTAGVPPPPG